jgi:hypothetical protein
MEILASSHNRASSSHLPDWRSPGAAKRKIYVRRIWRGTRACLGRGIQTRSAYVLVLARGRPLSPSSPLLSALQIPQAASEACTRAGQNGRRDRLDFRTPNRSTRSHSRFAGGPAERCCSVTAQLKTCNRISGTRRPRRRSECTSSRFPKASRTLFIRFTESCLGQGREASKFSDFVVDSHGYKAFRRVEMLASIDHN